MKQQRQTSKFRTSSYPLVARHNVIPSSSASFEDIQEKARERARALITFAFKSYLLLNSEVEGGKVIEDLIRVEAESLRDFKNMVLEKKKTKHIDFRKMTNKGP